MPKRIAPTTFDWVIVVVAVVWLFMLWTYGATPWQKILLGFGTAVWWGIGHWWLKQRQGITKKPQFALTHLETRWSSWWLLWLLAVGVNVLTSQIPLQSAVALFWWLMSGLWFWWWASLLDQQLKKWLVVQILCLGLGIFTCLSWLVAWFHPHFIIQSSLELSPNFLVPFFGHHHLAALIVLIWPLGWLMKRYGQFSINAWRSLAVVWLALLSVTIWFAFSRSAWLAVLLQFGIICFIYRQKIKQNLKVWVLSGGIFILVLLVGFLLKDLMQSRPFVDLPQPIRKICYQWWAPDSLCSVAPEPRLQYWKQAVVVWQQLPWFGSGLATFGQVTKRWQTNTQYQAQYPHQIFLQVLSEQGVLGLVLWLGFFGLLFFDLFRQVRQGSALQNWPFFLAIFGGMVIGNLDFDWQLAGFWWPFLMLISTVMTPPVTTPFAQSKKIGHVLLWVGIVIAVLGGVISGLTYWHLMTNKAEMWLKIWPYSAEWQALTGKKIQDRAVWQGIVQRHYRQSPEVWFGAMTDIHDAAERWFWLEQLWLIDPWRYWETNPLVTARKNQNVVQINTVLDRLQLWLLVYPDSKIQKYNSAFAVELFELADESLLRGNGELAQKSLVLAQTFDPWILHNRLPSMMGKVLDAEKAPVVLQIFSSLNQERYGDNLVLYRDWYRQLIEQQVSALLQKRQKLVGVVPISSQWLPSTTVNLSDWADSVAVLGTQSLVLLPDPQSRGSALSQKLSELLVEAGDATVFSDTNRVSELYQVAQKIQPWVLDGKLWWFERLRLIKPATNEFVSFAQNWSAASPAVTGFKPHAWMLFHNRVLLLSLRSGNSAAAFASLRAVEHYWAQAKIIMTP